MPIISHKFLAWLATMTGRGVAKLLVWDTVPELFCWLRAPLPKNKPKQDKRQEHLICTAARKLVTAVIAEMIQVKIESMGQPAAVANVSGNVHRKGYETAAQSAVLAKRSKVRLRRRPR
ncbi:hypothetical protein F5Y17DRAFT_351519 [Xylariaceae sp. FL0594]|nr:hypothetical protein F5Y17DRAFT_351519 [Xylariaceae sp. FL0594]